MVSGEGSAQVTCQYVPLSWEVSSCQVSGIGYAELTVELCPGTVVMIAFLPVYLYST